MIAFSMLLAASAAAAPLSVLVEDQSGKPVADAVVFARSAPAAAAAAEPAVMDLADLEFVPRVLAVPIGTKLRFPNKDQIHHQVYSFSKPKKFELPLFKGEEPEPVLFDKPGLVKLGCNIHDNMLAFVLVSPSAAFAKTGADGKATLELPAGAHELEAWAEGLAGEGGVKQVLEVSEKGGAARFKLKLAKRRKASAPSGY